MKSIQLNDQTTIPILWLASVVLVGAGFEFWLSTIYSDVAQAKADVSAIKNDVKEDRKEIFKYLQRLERGQIQIQTKLGIKPDSSN